MTSVSRQSLTVFSLRAVAAMTESEPSYIDYEAFLDPGFSPTTFRKQPGELDEQCF